MPAVVKVAFLLFFLTFAVHSPSSSSAITISVNIESKKNEIGQWITKVGMEHRKRDGPRLMSTDICEGDDSINITTTISPSTKERPPGYELFPGFGYYKFHTNGTSWQDARLTCTNEGTHLVIINSEKEADVVAQLFARFPKTMINAAGNDDWAWAGARELGVDGEYYTVFGEPLNSTGFTRWVKGQPDNKDGDTAVITNRFSGGLGDAFPAWTAAFICEMEL